MGEFSFRVELEPTSSNKFNYIKIIYNDSRKEIYEGNIFNFIYWESMRIMETKTEFETDHEKNEILAQLSLWKAAPMIQIRCRENDNSEDIEIVCPYFIVDPKNLSLQDVPGTDHVEILNQGVKVFELDPLQGYTFTLKPRGIIYLWILLINFLLYFVSS